jgi:DNA polymerase-3 subunit epsilon/oligoribonuclease
MYLIFLDSETTGINPEKHRLLEIAYKVIDSITRKTVLSYETIVSQPLEIWAEADPSSLEVTGFFWEDTLRGKTESVVADEIIQDLNHLQLGTKTGVFICQNPSFDRAFFAQLIHVELQKHFGWPYHWLDLASMYWAIQISKDPSKLAHIKENDLSKDEIARSFGITPEGYPHRAMNGVNHLIACYEALLGSFSNHSLSAY